MPRPCDKTLTSDNAQTPVKSSPDSASPVLDIDPLLQQRGVFSLYQPLVSVKKRSLLGFEALSRGISNNGEIISPACLFRLPANNNQKMALDRLCRDKALEGFGDVHHRYKDLVLSINLDVSLLDTLAAGSAYLVNQTKRFGINPNNVVIELIESNVRNNLALLDFIARYRDAGFLIALDDIGSGHSNMERIAQIKPDVLKIDRSLISGIHKEFYKLEVTKSLIGLGQRIGAMVVAEGVECEEEAMALLELGVDVFQGFYFARPALLEHGQHPPQSMLDALNVVEHVASRFKQRMLTTIGEKKRLYAMYDAILKDLINSLEQSTEQRYDRVLAGFMTMHSDLECLYVLDECGMQISESICNPMNIVEAKRFIYQPAQKGADHSLKDYFLPIDAGLPKFTTESYISLASGNLCTTIAAAFTSRAGSRHIVCMDISRQGGIR